MTQSKKHLTTLFLVLALVFFSIGLFTIVDKNVSAADTETTTITEPAGILHIEADLEDPTKTDGSTYTKVKNMTYNGLVKVGDKTAYYFTQWSGKTGNPEVRFVTDGTYTNSGTRTFKQYNATKFSFSYKTNVTDITTVIASHYDDVDGKEYPAMTQVIKNTKATGDYSYDHFDIQNDESWHTVEYTLTADEMAAFCGINIKLGTNGFDEDDYLYIADIKVYSEVVTLETAKVKGMTYEGYKVGDDGKQAYFFSNSTDTADNGEVRFSTENTQTVTKVDGKYTFDQYPATAISFDYKLTNSGKALTTEAGSPQYLVQIFGDADLISMDGKNAYLPITFTPTVDGEWHTFESVLTAKQMTIFSGFIIKMGNLNGSLAVTNVKVDSLDVDTKTGASVRLYEPYGIRWQGSVNKTSWDELSAKGYTLTSGVLVAPYDYVSGLSDFTIETLKAAEKSYVNIENTNPFKSSLESDSEYGWYGSLVNIKDYNLNRKFAGRAYVIVNDGTSSYTIYGDYVVADHVRTYEGVLESLIKDTASDESAKTYATGILDKVVNVSEDGTLITRDGYTSPYSVTKTDSVYTISVSADSGNIENVSIVCINGKNYYIGDSGVTVESGKITITIV